MVRETALIVGVGRATGQAVCRQWRDRYKLILVARSTEFITALADEPPDAHALPCDVNAISLLQLVQTLFPDKNAIPAGSRIMISSSPAAYHPPARFLGLAPSRVAQRVLAELLHENLAHRGLAFPVFSINGAIDEPKMRAMHPDKPTSFFIQPDDVARAMVSLFDGEDFELSAEIRGESSHP